MGRLFAIFMTVVVCAFVAALAAIAIDQFAQKVQPQNPWLVYLAAFAGLTVLIYASRVLADVKYHEVRMLTFFACLIAGLGLLVAIWLSW